MSQDVQKKAIWEQYISNLFADDRPQLENNLEDDLSVPSITIEDILLKSPFPHEGWDPNG